MASSTRHLQTAALAAEALIETGRYHECVERRAGIHAELAALTPSEQLGSSPLRRRGDAGIKCAVAELKRDHYVCLGLPRGGAAARGAGRCSPPSSGAPHRRLLPACRSRCRARSLGGVPFFSEGGREMR